MRCNDSLRSIDIVVGIISNLEMTGSVQADALRLYAHPMPFCIRDVRRLALVSVGIPGSIPTHTAGQP